MEYNIWIVIAIWCVRFANLAGTEQGNTVDLSIFARKLQQNVIPEPLGGQWINCMLFLMGVLF